MAGPELKVKERPEEAPISLPVIKRVDASVHYAASAAQKTSELLGPKLPKGDLIREALIAASNPRNIQSVRINVEG